MNFLGNPPGGADGPPLWANPVLFEAVRPSFGAKLHYVSGFSEQAHGWAKKFIRTSEQGLCKRLRFKLMIVLVDE